MAKEPLMTAGEVAAYLRCSLSTVRRMVMRGHIPHYRLGKLVRFRRQEIEGWLNLHREGQPGHSQWLPNPNQLSLFGPESGLGEG